MTILTAILVMAMLLTGVIYRQLKDSRKPGQASAVPTTQMQVPDTLETTVKSSSPALRVAEAEAPGEPIKFQALHDHVEAPATTSVTSSETSSETSPTTNRAVTHGQ